MTLIQRLAGCRKGRVWRGSWGEFDLEKPYDSLRWRTLNRWEWVKERPSIYAWRIADVLCRVANRLRKHRVHEGWYGLPCNEAERLRQNIDEHLLPCGELKIDSEDVEEMRDNLDRLAALARATYWHDQ